ncbi:unnamed protein product [Lepeophtheirus salmonis]|uniref:Protein THEM6 n=1 Tax=Lepeophtheirus salmonis TaxID=72036 RepID=A0A7R8CLG0_LEPSM|nr:unnamed protein product [Lepeophtheirus salmonis]CAF2858285.1 unnamed protein product [Lepeophtheirus salmonis]
MGARHLGGNVKSEGACPSSGGTLKRLHLYHQSDKKSLAAHLLDDPDLRTFLAFPSLNIQLGKFVILSCSLQCGYPLQQLYNFSHFDIFWFLRWIIAKLTSYIRAPLSLKDESVVYSICYTTDIDYFFHMNNSRYLREFDFGRFDFYYRTRLLQFAEKQAGSYIVQHAASIRYRLDLGIFEQMIVTVPDQFVRAVAFCKNTAVNFNVAEYMKNHHGMVAPSKIPEDLARWMESNELSSNKLRLTGHGNSVASNLYSSSGKMD